MRFESPPSSLFASSPSPRIIASASRFSRCASVLLWCSSPCSSFFHSSAGSLRHPPCLLPPDLGLHPPLPHSHEELGFRALPASWQARRRDGLPAHFRLHSHARNSVEEGSQGGIQGGSRLLGQSRETRELTHAHMTQDAFKSVYNWQFVHAVDFWSLVLSSSCEKERIAQYGESPLQQLLYPLIQVALGAIR